MTKRSLPRLVQTLLLLLPGSALALSAPAGFEGLEAADQEALETIATHDEAVREAVLLATQHVEVLVEGQRIQDQSSQRFRERIDELPEDLREMVWEVVREPELMEELASDGPRSGAELDAIASRHPASLERAIRTLGRSHVSLLSEILRIDRVAWDRFESLLTDLPPESQQAFRDLVERPELFSLLAQRVRLAVYLGDSFRDDPAAARRHLADLSVEVAARDAAAEEHWRTAMQDDPQAASELELSARSYADEYGYDYDDLTEYEVTTRIHTVVHPYPYWYGYPAHYADHYLYPYGYWYPYPVHFGFYYAGHHHRHHHVHFGLPSLHFLHWYFGDHHDRHYRHLSHRFERHHRHHRHARSHHHRMLSRWAKHEERQDRHGWLLRDRDREERRRDRSESRDERRGGREQGILTRFGPRRQADRGDERTAQRASLRKARQAKPSDARVALHERRAERHAERKARKAQARAERGTQARPTREVRAAKRAKPHRAKPAREARKAWRGERAGNGAHSGRMDRGAQHRVGGRGYRGRR